MIQPSPYLCNLPDKDLTQHGRFIAEGNIVVRRLLHSSLQCESILCGPAQAEELTALDPDVPVTILDKQGISEVVGYNFHRGALAVGVIPPEPEPETTLATWLKTPSTRLLLLPHCGDPQNLGSLIRTARALGFTGVVVGEHSCSLYSRRTVRVAMGSMFDFPVIQVSDFMHWGRLCAEAMPLWAFSLSPNSEALHTKTVPPKIALMLGNEGDGLDLNELALACSEVIIPITDGTDSLSITTSGAIAMYSVTQAQ